MKKIINGIGFFFRALFLIVWLVAWIMRLMIVLLWYWLFNKDKYYQLSYEIDRML